MSYKILYSTYVCMYDKEYFFIRIIVDFIANESAIMRRKLIATAKCMMLRKKIWRKYK